jgi:HAMP domain-containing protein
MNTAPAFLLTADAWQVAVWVAAALLVIGLVSAVIWRVVLAPSDVLESGEVYRGDEE